MRSMKTYHEMARNITGEEREKYMARIMQLQTCVTGEERERYMEALMEWQTCVFGGAHETELADGAGGR